MAQHEAGAAQGSKLRCVGCEYAVKGQCVSAIDTEHCTEH